MQPAVEAGAREARESELREDEPARGEPHAPREARVPHEGEQPAARPKREEKARERDERERDEQPGPRREARTRSRREHQDERRERQRREISTTALGRTASQRVGWRKNEVEKVRRSDRPRERLRSRHAPEPAGGRRVFEKRKRRGGREGCTEKEAGRKPENRTTSRSRARRLVAARRERDEGRADRARHREGGLAAEKRERGYSGKPRRGAASRCVPRREEEPREEGRRLEIVVDEREGKERAPSRKHGRTEKRAGARRAECEKPGRRSGRRDHDVEDDTQERSPGPRQQERQVPRVENARLELGEPRLTASRERIPERHARRPARCRVGLHRPEEVGEIASNRHSPGEGTRGEKESREREPQGTAEQRRPSRHPTALHYRDSRPGKRKPP